MSEEAEPVQPSELKDRKLPENILDELTSFNRWLEKKKKNKTRSDYLTYVAGFYAYSKEEHDRIRVVDFNTEEPEEDSPYENSEYDRTKDHMMDYIHERSKAVEYGLKAYLDFITKDRVRDQAREATFLRDEIHGEGDTTIERTREDKIGEKVRSKNTVEKVVSYAPTHTKSMEKDQLSLFLQVMYDTAGRVRDILKLQWRDVDKDRFKDQELGENQIFISADRSKSRNSGIVNLRSDTKKRLEEYRGRKDIDDSPNKQVFFQDREPGPWPTEQGKRYYDRILRAMKTAAYKHAGLGKKEMGTHDFRHSRLVHYGRAMIDDGHTYATAKERLQDYGRHDDMETTEIYIEILKEPEKIDLTKYD